MTGRLKEWLAHVGVWLLLGCSPGPGERVHVERTDSAGVEIVRNFGEVSLDRHFERSFALGGADAGPASFYRIWRHGLGTDSSGTIYVLDASAPHVVLFDSSGAYLRTLGQKGGGPGEFTMPAAVAVKQDGRFAVYDRAKRGLVWFARDGSVLEGEALTVPYRGGLLRVSDTGVFVPVRETDREQGLMHYRLLYLGASDTAELAVQNQPVHKSINYTGCGLSIGLPPLFTAELVWDAKGNSAAVVRGAEYVIDLYDGTEPQRSIRRDVAVRPITKEMALAEVGEGEEWTWSSGRCTVPPQEVVEQRGFAEELPSIKEVALTPSGEVWAKRGAVRGEPVLVDVFSGGGEYLGTLPEGSPWPAAFLPDGRLIAIEKDDLGVERLLIYRIKENGGDGMAVSEQS